MKAFIVELLYRAQKYGKSITALSAFVDIPWLIFDDNGTRSIFMFRRKSNEFLISIHGSVKYGTWEYLQSMNSILVNLNNKSDLFGISFMDGSIMILRKDGTDFNMLLANETKFKAQTAGELMGKMNKEYVPPPTKPTPKPAPTNPSPPMDSPDDVKIKSEKITQDIEDVGPVSVIVIAIILFLFAIIGLLTKCYKS